MSLLPFFDWCQSTALAGVLRNSIVAAPVIDVLHLLGLAMVFGPVFVLNLRLFGFAITGQPAVDVAAALMPWWRRGLALSAASGVLFFVGNAIKAYNVAPFYVKMAMLGMAITFQCTVVLAAAESPSRLRRWLSGLFSMFLWTGVPVAGYWIELY